LRNPGVPAAQSGISCSSRASLASAQQHGFPAARWGVESLWIHRCTVSHPVQENLLDGFFLERKPARRSCGGSRAIALVHLAHHPAINRRRRLHDACAAAEGQGGLCAGGNLLLERVADAAPPRDVVCSVYQHEAQSEPAEKRPEYRGARDVRPSTGESASAVGLRRRA